MHCRCYKNAPLEFQASSLPEQREIVADIPAPVQAPSDKKEETEENIQDIHDPEKVADVSPPPVYPEHDIKADPTDKLTSSPYVADWTIKSPISRQKDLNMGKPNVVMSSASMLVYTCMGILCLALIWSCTKRGRRTLRRRPNLV